MKSPFAPNAKGLVIVVMDKAYASNVAGEKAGFLPEIAKALVKKGIAHLPGEAPAASEAATGPEMTTRKFRPLDHDKDGKKGGSPKPAADDDLTAARQEYREALNRQPFHGWDAAELRKRIAEAQADA